MAGIINLKWTWLILAIVCVMFYFFVVISYFLSENNTSKKRGYGNLLSFSNLFILPIGMLFFLSYYIFVIIMEHSKKKISKSSSAKGKYVVV